MYTIVKTKRKTKIDGHDYVFKDFKSFYDLASTLTVPLIENRYSVAIKTDDTSSIKEFIENESRYASLMVYIYAPETVVDYLSLYNTGINIQDTVSTFDTFKELVKSKNLLFDKYVMQLLYSSIDHDYDSMDEATTKVLNEYGSQVSISEKMLSSIFVLNKVTYPRSVLVAYINMDRNRQSKLNRCLHDVGNDVALGAIVKNIKAFVEQKTEYFKTGKGSNFIKSLNTNNLNQLYRIFVVERNGLNDVCILFSLYERGLSAYDLIQKE